MDFSSAPKNPFQEYVVGELTNKLSALIGRPVLAVTLLAVTYDESRQSLAAKTGGYVRRCECPDEREHTRELAQCVVDASSHGVISVSREFGVEPFADDLTSMPKDDDGKPS